MPELASEPIASLEAMAALLDDAPLADRLTHDDDLALLRDARERLERRSTLAVVGEFSSGKSYFLNALTGKARYDPQGRITGLLATDINPSTATITELEYGITEIATARYPSGRSERVPLDLLARYVAVGKDAPGKLHDAVADPLTHGDAPEFVTVAIDSPFLQAGFTIADTPGLASLNPAHRRATLGYLPRTDAVFYLIDTQQPFSEGDAAFLELIGAHVHTIFIVQTKIDLWVNRDASGCPAWQTARKRIEERAARAAPQAEVYSVSARDYAAGMLAGDEALVGASGFPALIAGLERSLAARVRTARIAHVRAVLHELIGKTGARVRRELALGECDETALAAERERAASELAERERGLDCERAAVVRSGNERRTWIRTRGNALATGIVRALGAALDVAAIERLRDRGRLHSLVDAIVAPSWTAFANEVAEEVTGELCGRPKLSIAPALSIADIAARRLGGEPGAGVWTRGPAPGIAATIVLGAIGGPTIDFVHRIARAFGSQRQGTYMKRELGADLTRTFFPALESDVDRFVAGVAARIAGIYDDVAAAIEGERRRLRAEFLAPIDRALAYVQQPAARHAIAARLGEAASTLARIETSLTGLTAASQESTAPATFANVAAGAPFDADAYDRSLRPERYRVVVLGALHRGKSSLINAIAGTALLHDEGGTEALFPIHVRYGERERAYTLEGSGSWSEIDSQRAMAAAARAPVLIETPWSMPKQLVLVHAPAFDSGNAGAENIALAAAGVASEILALFSRQLSERELALYARVAESHVPMLLAHTIADNESPSERRTVVELAARYARERAIPIERVFTISALDFFDAGQNGRAPAAWNELSALRETLAAHAEEHMRKLAERERLAAEVARLPVRPKVSESKLRRALGRFFGRGRSGD